MKLSSFMKKKTVNMEAKGSSEKFVSPTRLKGVTT
jgi:hypothetical protein